MHFTTKKSQQRRQGILDEFMPSSRRGLLFLQKCAFGAGRHYGKEGGIEEDKSYITRCYRVCLHVHQLIPFLTPSSLTI